MVSLLATLNSEFPLFRTVYTLTGCKQLYYERGTKDAEAWIKDKLDKHSYPVHSMPIHSTLNAEMNFTTIIWGYST